MIKKALCSFALLFVLVVYAGDACAESNPLELNIPVSTNWVTDQKSGIKLLVLGSDKPGESKTVYEWQGGSLNGYAHGEGSVNEYKNNTLTVSYRGTFDHGKMQGHFIGKAYGKNLGNIEWDCVDGNLKKLNMVLNDGKMEGIVENNKISDGYMVRKSADGTTMEIRFAKGEPVSVKMEGPKGYYEGGFNKNGMNGTGLLKVKDSFTYEGDFANNKMHGKGKFTFPNGSFYVGDFQEGKLTGYGKYYDREGKLLKQGRWENSKFVESMPIGN